MTPKQARALVATIDLNAICRKVQVQQRWDAATIARAEQEYRDYLTAALANPGRSVPPSRTADEIWHAHILDTAKYAADCQRVFGAFLHHVPNYRPYLDAAADTALCFARRAEADASDTAFCVCMAEREEPADAALCFARREQPENATLCFARTDAPAGVAGCVPCFGQRDQKTASRPAPTPRRVRGKARRIRG